MTKAEGAFRTIGEVATETGVAQHVLRYWESRFPQLRPLQRAGNRRYYRQTDVVLVRRIDSLLNHQGYTVKGVQKLLAEDGSTPPTPVEPKQASGPVPESEQATTNLPSPLLAELRVIRDALAAALATDGR